MSELHTVEAYVVETIKDEVVPGEIAGCPLSLAARRLLLAECPIVVVDPNVPVDTLPFTSARAVNGYDADAVRIRQPSTVHHRSFELFGPGMDVAWQDIQGNTYGSFNLKGNNFSNPGVMEHPTAVDQYVAWGLQESKIIQRVLRASDVLRSRGIGTEYIMGLAEPQVYPHPNLDPGTTYYRAVSLSEYRQSIVEKYWQQLPGTEQTVEKLADITAKFQEMTFYVSLRAVDTSTRFGDIWQYPTTNLARVYEHTNRYDLDPGDTPFDTARLGDRSRYLSDILAPKLGVNLARLHDGLAHGFMHAYNITGLGSIVDTDSVHGEPLNIGDEPVTVREIAYDVFCASLELMNANTSPVSLKSNLVALQIFFKSYLQESVRVHGYNDPAKAEIHLAEVALALEGIVNNHHWEPFGAQEDTGKHLLELFYSAYFNEVFGDADQTESGREAQNEIAASIIDFACSDHTVELLYQNLLAKAEDYAHDLVDDYLNELEDPDFDVVSNFLTSKSSHWVRQTITSDIIGTILESYKPDGQSHDTKPFHNNDAVNQLLLRLAHSSCLPDLQAVAANIQSELLPRLASELRLHTNYTRPKSILNNVMTRPCTGPKHKGLWLTTEGVEFGELIDKTKDQNLPTELFYLESPGAVKRINLEIKQGDQLREIITDGMVENSSYTKGSPGLEVSIGRDTVGDPTYAYLVREKDDGSLSCCVYLTSEMAALLEGIASDQLAANDGHLVLF